MTARAMVTAAGLTGLAVLLLVLGAAARPLVTDDRTPAEPVLNPTETGFAQDMLAHHNQALIMISRLDPGADSAVLAIARQIETVQRGEIGQLTGWLRLAGRPSVNPTPMSWMHRPDPTAADHHHDAKSTDVTVHDTAMPGMATWQELDALAAARGQEASVLFLRLMQRHHYGGIEMARAADLLLDGGVIEQTARDMMSSQGREAGLMGVLLDSLSQRR
ncbi:DUF305 domain-containing protein [Nocardia bovistercoris]|uniref:DUF305 domain-containing protein n=1 Tax=Nocardia bovistercoris TaxID=2785916 RepID=A0A931IHJ9_9NOCA|nr:DUF305 domain-containing protein [Nocardia bovistercoris]MBH0779845.1 DUF305 domain-containing protein [Nocardia bovistercoris]